MLNLRDLKRVKSYEGLEGLEIGKVYCDISYRGGGIGFYASDVARAFDVNESDLPGKFGAYCNYLGGGLRGCICESSFSDRITGRKARLLEELVKACVRAYESCEQESEIENDPINTGIGRVNQKSAY